MGFMLILKLESFFVQESFGSVLSRMVLFGGKTIQASQLKGVLISVNFVFHQTSTMIMEPINF